MKYDDIMRLSLTYFPDPMLGDDLDWQMIIYTGLYPKQTWPGSPGDIEYLPRDEQGEFDFSYNPPLPPTVEEEDDLKGAHEDI